jgi:poly(3-hydroxybutyrate) depolymerase
VAHPGGSLDFTGRVIEALKERFNDPRRVYVFGHSGGGGHALLLRCSSRSISRR